MTIRIGDCLEVLKSYPTSFFDSCASDPPYGLEFMDEEWDTFKTGRMAAYKKGSDGFGDASGLGGGFGEMPSFGARANRRCGRCGLYAWSSNPCGCPDPSWVVDVSVLLAFQRWCEEWCREVYRVLKPGGHAVLFGSPRTHHRLIVAAEDVGFEVRDVLHWCYGSGMPKAQEVSKGLDRMKANRADVLRITAWVREARDLAGKTNREIDQHFGLKGMAGHWTTARSQPLVPTAEQWTQLVAFLGVEPPAEVAELCARIIREKGVPGDAWFEREVVGQHEQPAGMQTWKETLTGEGATTAKAITKSARAESRAWEDWWTALKPGHEPIVLLRKPLIGSVAQNVASFGVGALNIGATRVQRGAEAGWPANVLLTHSIACDDKACAEGCPVREVDAQREAAGAAESTGAADLFPTYRWQPETDWPSEWWFRYCAKPSVSEKQAGLEEWTPETVTDEEGTRELRTNIHPTVKPVALMRWLIRLITPPGGRVIEPFCGSGTTAVAAMLEGFECDAIEREEKYAKIAQAREDDARERVADLAAAADRSKVPDPRSRDVEEKRQTSLFGGG